jgi:hypothetical protein
MPTPEEILSGLAAISNDFVFLATAWHVLLAAVLITILLGWRLSRKLGASLLAVPLLSVSILAWMHGNPFNGAVFLIFAIVLGVIGLRLPPKKTPKTAAWWLVVGGLMITFGWIYPHFFERGAWVKYLYASPAGLIPCPTLSVVIGLALLAGGFSSRAWAIVLAALGIFYGLFGALRLGVRIDFVLSAGALLLFLQSITMKQAVSPRRGAA